MIRCSSATCTFWVHAHQHGGTALTGGQECPWCQSVLIEVSPESPHWQRQRELETLAADIDGSQFVTPRGKIVRSRVERYSGVMNVPYEAAMLAAQRHCVPCGAKP